MVVAVAVAVVGHCMRTLTDVVAAAVVVVVAVVVEPALDWMA